MAYKCLPIDNGRDENPLRTILLPLIMTDPILFQASTSFAAVHLDLITKHKSQPKTLLDKSKTIYMVNLRLQCPDQATADSTIGAVAILAAMEVSEETSQM